MQRMKASDFPQEVLNLFDRYVHGGIDRRQFIDKASKYAVGGMTATAMFEALKPNFALGEQVSATDSRIKGQEVSYPSPQGNSKTSGYLVTPANAKGKLPTILVVHENRGLNPHIRDIARRLAVANYVAFAPEDRKSTRLNSSHSQISYAVFCLKKKKKHKRTHCERLVITSPA